MRKRYALKFEHAHAVDADELTLLYPFECIQLKLKLEQDVTRLQQVVDSRARVQARVSVPAVSCQMLPAVYRLWWVVFHLHSEPLNVSLEENTNSDLCACQYPPTHSRRIHTNAQVESIHAFLYQINALAPDLALPDNVRVLELLQTPPPLASNDARGPIETSSAQYDLPSHRVKELGASSVFPSFTCKSLISPVFFLPCMLS